MGASFLARSSMWKVRYRSSPVQDNWDRRLSSTSRRVDERAQGSGGSHQPHQVCDDASWGDYVQTERFLGVAALFLVSKHP